MHKVHGLIHKHKASEKIEKIFRKSTFRVPGLRSWVPPLWSRVSDPQSHLWVGSRVSGLKSHLLDPGSQVPGPTYEMGPGSRVSGPTKSPGSQVPLFGYAMNFCRTSSKFLLASRKHFQEKYSLCINKNLWKICCFNRLEPLQKKYF